MTILPLVAALQLATSCAPSVAPDTLLSVVGAESAFDTLAVGDNTDRQSYHPGSLADAVALASRLIAAGHNVDLGAAQLNWSAGHLQRRNLPIGAAFDPCISFRVGGEVLIECWGRATGANEQARLGSAIGCYNAGHPSPNTAYVQRVQASAAQIVPAIRVAGLPASNVPVLGSGVASSAPPGPPPPPSWDVWDFADWQKAPRELAAPALPAAPVPAPATPFPLDTHSTRGASPEGTIEAAPAVVLEASRIGNRE